MSRLMLIQKWRLLVCVLAGAVATGAQPAWANCYCQFKCKDNANVNALCSASAEACSASAVSVCGSGNVDWVVCTASWTLTSTGLRCETYCGDGEAFLSLVSDGQECAEDSVRICGPVGVNQVMALNDAPNLRCPSDLTHDLQTNASDLALNLGGWGQCVANPCVVASDCVDQDPCTLDTCLDGACVHEIIIPCCGDFLVEGGEDCDPPDGLTCGDGCHFSQPTQSSCCVAHVTPGCDNLICQGQVCAVDPFCCNGSWDDICADEAVGLCPGLCSSILLEVDGSQPGSCCLGQQCLGQLDVLTCTQLGGSFMGPNSDCHPGACAAVDRCKVTQTGGFAPLGGCPAAFCAALPGVGGVWCSTATCPPLVCPAPGVVGALVVNCPGGGQCQAPAVSNGCGACP